MSRVEGILSAPLKKTAEFRANSFSATTPNAMRKSLLVALLLAATIGAFALPQARTFGADAVTTESLRDAFAGAKKLAARRDLDAAQAEYERIAATAPAQGLPELARFLRLTGRKDALAHLLEHVDAPTAGNSPTLRAQVRAAAGEDAAAIEILKAQPSAVTGADVGATMLLANLLKRQSQQDEWERVLETAITQAPDPKIRAVLFDSLFSFEKVSLGADGSRFAAVLAAGLEAVGPDRAWIVNKIDPIILSLQQRGLYFKVREGLLTQQKTLKPGAAWFVARMAVREEEFDLAVALLTESTARFDSDPLWPLLAEEYAIALRSAGRGPESRAMFETIIARGPKDPATVMEAARALLAAKNTDGALGALRALDLAALTFDQRRQYRLIEFNALSSAGRYGELLKAYGAATPSTSEEDFALYHQSIFLGSPETAQHHQIEKLIREQFAKAASPPPPNLWRLAAAAAAEARRKPNEIEALYQCVLLQPREFGPLKALAETVAPVAALIASTPPEKRLIPEGEAQQTLLIAEKALEKMIERQPLDPAPYKGLLELYEAQKIDAPGAKVAALVADSMNERVLGAGAYALAINGYPKDAITLYDKAATIAPEDLNIRTNRAACLTRLERWDEASAIYKQALENGQNGRNYHMHEMISRLWVIAQATNKEKECVEYFRMLAKTIPSQWRDEAVGDIGNLFTNMERAEWAEEFLTIVVNGKGDPKRRISAYESLARARFQSGNLPAAMETLTKAAAEFESDPDVATSVGHTRAELLSQAGKKDEAIAELIRLANKFPLHQQALDGIGRAATIAAAAGNNEEVLKYQRMILASNSNNFTLRRNASEALAAVEKTPPGKAP